MVEKRIKCSRIVNHVPAEIIDEILYKLPVKSLLRFKCVSKSWRSSISSKRFIREHLKKSNSGTDFTHHNLIFTFDRYQRHKSYITKFPNSIGSCCIGSLLNDDGNDEPNPLLPSNLSIPIPALEDNSPTRNSEIFVKLLLSCNGLILITISNTFTWQELYLLNPSTRKAKNITNASFPQEWKRNWHRSWCHSRYGFGYVESTDDYKVVFLKENPAEMMYMYSSRTDSWKKIRNFGNGTLLNRWPAMFVNGNGRLYWVTEKEDTISSWYIVSLDLVDEKYQIVPLPPCFSDSDDTFRPSLQELGGYLSLICYNRIRRNTMDVWAMKNESWSKIWTFSDIDHLPDLPFGMKDRLPNPLWSKNNGDIMVSFGFYLLIYHGEDKLRQSQVHMLHSKFDSVVYVESLVSPFGDDEQLRE